MPVRQTQTGVSSEGWEVEARDAFSALLLGRIEAVFTEQLAQIVTFQTGEGGGFGEVATAAL